MIDNSEIWLEKYRPTTLDEVEGNEEIIAQLKIIANEGNIPNLLITGPPGIGKTSSILCIAKAVMRENFGKACIELNASDERGIDVIREKIKSFAQQKANLEPGQHKIVILDEADSLTDGAQQALRMIISDYSDSTRFIFSCNESSQIIEPIQSRCAILRFSKLTEKQILKRLQAITLKEKVPYDEGGLEALIYTADGDMRQAINNLQATYFGLKKVTKENVLRVCDVPDVDTMRSIIDLAIDGHSEDSIKKLILIWDQGYCAYDLVQNLSRVIQYNNKIDRILQYELLTEVAVLKMKVLEGLNSQIQLAGFLCKVEQIAEDIRKKKLF